MMSNMCNLTSDNINILITDKLNRYPPEVRELAIRAVQLSEMFSEAAVVDQLLALVRKLARPQEGERG